MPDPPPPRESNSPRMSCMGRKFHILWKVIYEAVDPLGPETLHKNCASGVFGLLTLLLIILRLTGLDLACGLKQVSVPTQKKHIPGRVNITGTVASKLGSVFCL